MPRLLFLPTASGDPADGIARFYDAFAGLPCTLDHLSLFRLGAEGPRPLRELVLAQDAIYAGGGSMRNLLAIWKVHGLDEVLREAHERGIVLGGVSAGAMCWFEGGVTTSSGRPEVTPGLGFERGSLSVHADGQPERLPVYRAAVDAGRMPEGWAVDDGAGLLLRDGEPTRVVTARPGRGAHRVRAGASTFIEGELLADPERIAADDAVRELRALRYGRSLR